MMSSRLYSVGENVKEGRGEQKGMSLQITL